MTNVTLVTGDGIGPEIAEAARRCVDAAGAQINWDYAEAGVDVMEKYGTPMPEATVESIKKNGVALKAPITTPVGKGFRSVNVFLRQELDLYTCLRPAKSYKGVRSRYSDIDLIVDAGVSIKPITVTATEKIFHFAFKYARKTGRKKITSVHKANIMKYSDGLWLDVSREVAKQYTDIEFEDRIVDNMCMQLIQKPELYDCIVLPNLYGDIISDLCAGLVGGLGVAPGANIGDKGAIFEATHGSAPKYAGQNKVNPTALILSGVLMLRHMDKMAEADKLEKAVADVIAEGKDVTYDMKPNRDDPSAVGTKEMADAIIEKIKNS